MGKDPLTRTMVCKDLGFPTNTTTASEISEITKKVREHTLGAALLLGADPEQYSGMIRGLKNASLAGRDKWPKNITEAHDYLSKWEGDDVSARGSCDYEGVAFTSSTNPTREPQPWHAKMTCRNCNKVGHVAALCENNKVSNTNVQDAEVHEEAAQQLIDAVQLNITMLTCSSVKTKNTGVHLLPMMASTAVKFQKNGFSLIVNQRLMHSQTLTCCVTSIERKGLTQSYTGIQ
jgi:hypothetical protein